MTLEQKINKLNEYCQGSLGFQHYTVGGWEISSFKDGTFFEAREDLYKNNGRNLHNKSLSALVNEAYALMKGTV